MKLDLVEPIVHARIHAYADTLPVDTEYDWQTVLHRKARLVVEQRVVAWPGQQPQHRRRSYRRPALLVAAAAVVAGAATAGVLTLGSSPATGTPTLPEPLPFMHGAHDPAITLLQHAASLQDAVTPGSGPVRYAKVQTYALQAQIARRTSTTTVETTLREVWASGDGSALAKTALQDTTRAGVPVGPPGSTSTDNHWQDINTNLPSEATALRAALLGSDSTGDEIDLILAQAIMSHLGQGTTTPAQTASLYRLLAGLPGVFDAGTVIDTAGRSGHAIGILTGHFDAGTNCIAVSGASSSVTTAIARNHALGQGLTYLVLDPSTGQPLQVETVDTPNAPCGLGLPAAATIEQNSLILKAGRVNATGEAMP